MRALEVMLDKEDKDYDEVEAKLKDGFEELIKLQHDETCVEIASMAYERPQTLASGVERPHHAVAAMAYRWHVVTRRARQSPGQRRTRGRAEEVVAAH